MPLAVSAQRERMPSGFIGHEELGTAQPTRDSHHPSETFFSTRTPRWGDNVPKYCPQPPVSFGLRDACRGHYWYSYAAVSLLQSFASRAPQLMYPMAARMCSTPQARMGLFAASVAIPLAVPPVASLLDIRLYNVWQQSLFCRRVNSLIQVLQSQPLLHTNKELEVFARNELVDHGEYFEQEMISLVAQVVSMVIFTAVDLVQLYASFQSGYLLLFVGATAVAYFCGRYTSVFSYMKNPQQRRAQENIMASSRGFWDNMVLGNKPNQESWRSQFFANIQSYYHEILRSSEQQLWSETLQGLQWSLLWVMRGADELYLENFPGETAILPSAMIGGLQAACSMLSSVLQVSGIVGSYSNLQKKLRDRQTNLDVILQSNVVNESRIANDEIVICGEGWSCRPDELFADLALLERPGRVRITGKNGKGKSTILLLLMAHFGKRALLLPASHELNSVTQVGSSGQKVLQTFAFVEQLRERPYVLLFDEWTAHLDEANKATLDRKIKAWAEQHLVIEVVHNPAKTIELAPAKASASLRQPVWAGQLAHRRPSGTDPGVGPRGNVAARAVTGLRAAGWALA